MCSYLILLYRNRPLPGRLFFSAHASCARRKSICRLFPRAGARRLRVENPKAGAIARLLASAPVFGLCKRSGLLQSAKSNPERPLALANRFPVGLRLWQCRWGKTPPAFLHSKHQKRRHPGAFFPVERFFFSEVWKAAAFKAKQKPGGTNVFCHRPIFRQTKSAGIPALFLQQDRLRCAARQYTPAKQQKKRVMGIEPT